MEKYSALCLLLYVIAGCIADGEYLERWRSLIYIFAVFYYSRFLSIEYFDLTIIVFQAFK